MTSKLNFNPTYSVATLGEEQVFLLSEREAIVLSDRLTCRIANLLQTKHYSIDEIIEIIQLELLQDQNYSFENTNFFQSLLDISIKTQYAIFQMEQQGYLVESDDYLPSHLAIFCHHLCIPPFIAAQRLQSTTVAVKTCGSLPTYDLINILKSLNIQLANTGDITVVLTDDYLHPQLAEFNQQALNSQSPWMLVNPLGTMAWIGPIFHPQKTGCWECLAHRWRNNRPINSFLHRQKQITLSPPLGFITATVQTVLGMVATEIFKWIVQGENQQLTGTIITYDTLNLQTQTHILFQRPQCLICGEEKELEKQPLPIVLGNNEQTLVTDGGYRVCSPQTTLSKYQHHISPITGVVRELSKIPTNGLTHTYIAKHHFHSIFDDFNSLRQNIGGRSAGKGRTEIQAQASGFCEAIERYSGVFQGDEIRYKSSYQRLGNQAIHPNACMNFSHKQYQHREQWNGECQGWFQKVPLPFDIDREIDWTPVWSLTHQEFKYLPTAYCYYGYPQDQPDCWADSNGCAAGNTLEEAILQGFMELVERDCVALWWYNRLRKPQVDLESFDEPYFESLNKYYQAIDRQLWVLDITSDFQIPTFAAISRRTDRDLEDIILGYGTHFDPKLAISRALTEVNQILPNVLTANADGSTQYPSSGDRLAIAWWQSAKVSNHTYLLPDSNTHKVYADYLPPTSSDLLASVQLCQQIVEKNGLEMLVLDQTRPDIGLKVVKVIVPGMRHMWKRLGSGRLYDVPVKMGWLQQSLTEEQLNPYPMWM